MLYAVFTSQHRIRDRPRFRSLISHRRIHPFSVTPFVSSLLHPPLTTSILRVIYLSEVRDPFTAGVFVHDRPFEVFDLGRLASGFAVAALTALRGFLLLFFPLAFPAGRAVAAVVLPFAAGPQAATLLVLPGRKVFLLVLHSAILKPDLHLLL